MDEKEAERAGGKPDRPRRGVRRRRWLCALLVLVAVLGAARLALPSFVRSYVVRVLDRSTVYAGTIGDVRIHLWRGAYEIDDVRIVKTTGLVPVPFFAAKRLQFQLEWPALWAGQVVARVVMDGPELNFVDAQDESRKQTGAGGPWLEMLRDLSPFRINSTQVHEGEVHFRAFHTDPPVDVFLTHLEGSIENLTNIHEDLTPMVSTVHATALAMEHAKVEFEMKLDPFSYRPSFHLAARMLGLDVTKVNSLALAYGRFDFEHGFFDLVVEMDAKEGSLEGYVKPLFRDLVILDLKKDLVGADVLSLFWEALVGLAKDVFKNQGRNQVATVIPMYGDIDAPKQDVLALIGNVLRNAFVRAYLPKLEGGAAESGGISFGPASDLGSGGIEK